jgi:hypothetical protein
LHNKFPGFQLLKPAQPPGSPGDTITLLLQNADVYDLLRHSILLLSCLLACGSMSVAFAACTNPDGASGALNWSSPKYQMCVGSTWTNITGAVSTTTCTAGGRVDRFGNEQYFCNGNNWVNPSCGTPSGTCVTAGAREYFGSGLPYYATCDGSNWKPWATTACALGLEFLGTKTSNANTTSYTFSNVNFGAEDPTRRIVIVVGNGGDSFTRTLTTTIAGTAGTEMVHGGGNLAFVSIFIAAVPTGTTGTISLSYSYPTVNHVVVGVYRLTGLSANTPFATSTYATTPPANLSLAVPAGGCVIAGIRRSASSSFTWSGLHEDYDLTISGGGGAIAQGYSGASMCFTNASPSQSIVATPTATGNPSAAAVSWGP